ncbi:hypothetical protein LJR225_001547 [Phenylobacterium sp. LjRoot225]|uniref:hypothetical protein n=1 Tax=Phenylobacterium sp. LjRoot225 TaxID=3342285 RepID=UPI003ECE8FE6
MTQLAADSPPVRASQRSPRGRSRGRAPETNASVEGSAQREDWLAKAIFIALLTSIVFLQKVAVPGNIELVLPVAWAMLGGSAIFFRIGIDVGRFVLFGIFSFFVIGSQFLLGYAFSQNSLMVGLAITALLCFKIYVKSATYLWMMRTFVNAMLLVAVIVGLQQVLQHTLGAWTWPNLDQVIPLAFQYRTYNYMQLVEWGSIYYKPNGIFFLETSVLSQYIALGFLVEFLFFRRAWALAILLGAEIATMGGTGLMLLLWVAPFLIPRLGPRALAAAIPAAGIVVALAISSGWMANVSTRMGTFSTGGSSANQRFVQPLLYFENLNSIGLDALKGIGAGNIPQVTDTVWWPATKVSAEYGVPAAIALYIYLVYSLFKGTVSRTLAFGCLVQYSILNGSYAMPIFMATTAMLVTLFHVRPEELGQLKQELRTKL